MSNDQPDARQERIDATARAVFAASFGTAGYELELRDCYSEGSASERLLVPDCDAAYRFAIALEAARERALLKEAK